MEQPQNPPSPEQTKKQKSKYSNEITGGIMFIGIGLVFFLDQMRIIRFHNTWPLILVGIGVVIILQAYLKKK